jgi:hypothetical protein
MHPLDILGQRMILLDGSFAKKEEEATAVPFQIGGDSFNRLLVLSVGIYPKYS